MTPSRSRWYVLLAALAVCLASVPLQPPALAQANVTGRWQTLPTTMPINPVHVALMHNGKVLVVSGSGNVAGNTNYQAGIWDPQTDTVTTMPVGWDMFCNGMIVLPDGRPFVLGGTLQYDPFHGETRTATFDPSTGTFTDQQSMAHGRWYPTGTVLGDGRVMVFSGLSETGGTNDAVELYTVGSGWSQEYSAPWVPPLYPRMHVLPNGKVFYSGSTTSSSIFDPSTQTWTLNVASTNYGGTRTYGTSVLMPLTPANGYKPRVMIFGGGSPATNTTEIIDLSVANPKWVYGTPMSQSRIEMNATILPNGTIVALGGSLNDEDATTASLNADLYDSVTGNRTSGGANTYPRLYHSNSMLLPDGTVWVVGGNPQRGTYESHMEIYSPPYLFNSNGTLATRPTITSVPSGPIGYNAAFQVQTPDAANISSVVLMRAGAVTHAFDMDQRMVGLSYTAGTGVLNVTSPPNGNIAPPGYYLLFILNSSGVPSVAKFVQILANPLQPPTGTITSPASNVSITAGQSVNFSGTGSDPNPGGTITGYSWTFPGGNPNSSALANPGNVTYSTPGTYTASLTVTDNSGLTDPAPPTRTITVNPPFSLSATPASQSVAAGNNTSYSVTVTPASGFTGAVTFSASGLPTGATASFNPTSVTTSGTTTMGVTTTTSTAAGTYPLTITGSSGGVNTTANVTLVVTSSGGGGFATITFVQVNAATPQSAQSQVPVTYPAAQTAGDLNIVVVGWNDTSSTVSSVTDSKGNAYTLAVGPTAVSGFLSQSIYYAKNIAGSLAGANTVTVKFNGSAAYADIRILEYGGLDPTTPLDVVSAGSGTTSASDSGGATTTTPNELLFGANTVYTGVTGAGTGYTKRIITTPDADLAEDQLVTATGTYHATAPLAVAGAWVMQLATFRAASTAPDTTPPTIPSNLLATTASSTQINLTWTASTDPDSAVSAYLIERCQGTGCSTFTQVGTSGTASYSDTGLMGSTSYSYRIRATDPSNNLSAYSSTASASTSAPTLTAPSSVSATAAGPVQINLSWGASNESGGTVSQYLIERCQGASCTTFAQVGTSTTLSYSDTGLSGSTSYSYRVRATDAANNLSPYSSTATATTAAPTFNAPSNLAATTASSTQINLSWTAATETGGTVSQYFIERCQGAGCTTFAQVGTSTTLSYSDTGLTGSTSYSYRVRAGDALNNFSGYSATATSTTAAPTFTAPTNLVATAAGPVQINLTWTAATETGGTITGYLVERCQGSGCSTFTQVGTSTTTSYSDAGLTGSSSYAYRVRATDAVNNLGPYSSVATATTSAPTFTAPTNLTAAAAGSTQINLSWTAGTESGGTISQYLVERCQGAGCSTFAQVGTSTTATYNDTGLTASTNYSYRVRATDASNNLSGYSNTASASTATSSPSAPSNLTATIAGPVQINLSWGASTESGGTINQYLVERCQGAGCTTFAQIGTSTTTSYSDTGLTGSTSYSYRVRASDNSSNLGPYSSTVAATTAAPTLTAPSALTANSSSPVQVSLSWGASSEMGGAISQYLIERCQGAGCTTFTQVGSSTSTTFTDSGLAGSTSYSYRVRATDAANNLSPYSNTATATTAAPILTAPLNLAATSAGSTQINLSWSAATESGGTISQYRVERCQGAGCTTFAQVGTSTTTSYSDTGLLAGTTYNYRVRAADASNNVSPYSNSSSATTSSSGPPAITFVQSNYATPQSPQSTVTVTFSLAQSAGDLNVVVVGWNDSSATVGSVSDAAGNAYALAVGPTVQSGTATQAIYYAKNIVAAAANSNVVSVKFNGSAVYPDIRIAEYSGIDPTSPLDGAAAATGNNSTASSGAASTTNANDLIIGANLVQTGTSGPGSGFTRRVITVPDSDILEDMIVTSTGNYTATAPLSPSGQWIMQVVAFKRHP